MIRVPRHSLPMADTSPVTSGAALPDGTEETGVSGPPEALGRVVGAVLAALARWRRQRPMHPRGVVFSGVLTRHGSARPWGVAWLDEPGRDDVVVRLSRGFGVPPPLPDLIGLAVRVPGDGDGRVDLLLSSSGAGPLGRLLVLPRLRSSVVHGSVMAYRSDAGSLRLAAFPLGDDGRTFGLAAAHGSGPWRRFARLDLVGPARPDDPDLRFDAVGQAPPGLVPDGPMARFRAPAYAAAHDARPGRDRTRGRRSA
jgi:hypothetical protein